MGSLLSLYPRFSFPEALLLLLLIPVSVYLAWKIRSLSPGRKWAAIIMRSIVIACLVGALAGAEMVRKHDKLAVFFLLDHSNSVPVDVRQQSVQWVRDTCKNFKKKDDHVGVIVFGERPSIELSVGDTLKLERVRSFVGGEQTDISAGMRLAMASFPQGFMRRMIVLSDGNETVGQAMEESKIAQSSGMAVDVWPLAIGGGAEVKISEVAAPNQTSPNEPFQLRVVIHSNNACAGILTVYQRVKEGKNPIGREMVDLLEGDNVILVTLELEDAGFYEYEATFEAEDQAFDTIFANNEGRSYTVVRGEPLALYVEADPENSPYLLPALLREGINVEMTDPASMPADLSVMQNYDVVILSNVSATELTIDQMTTIESAVRDLGIGLVMIGGPESFGAGGFLESPVERALPLRMDLKQRKILPSGALVLIMHTCEIPDGNVWAREIGLASLNVLASRDMMGALGFMWSTRQGQTGDVWIYPVQYVGDKSMMRAMLTNASTRIGDMPAVGPSLQLAHDGLVGVPAAVKRIVIISDGDPAAPPLKLVTQLQQAKISVSTVCISPHSMSDQGMLRNLALATGGNYYFVSNPRNLPQIFTKEATVVKRGILVEEPFTPGINHDSELLGGLQYGMPQLHGYVATTAKDKATVPLISHEKDPVLAHWRFGLGKSVAFTSDVTSRWASEWVQWDGFQRFWAQTARWAMRETSETTFRVEVNSREGAGYIKIDAVDEDGKFVNFLRPRAVVIGPGPKFERHELELIQTGPGIYEHAFPLSDRGTYMVNVTYATTDGKSGMIPAGLALSYSREYEYNETNLPLLENLAGAAGGRVLAEMDDPFAHDLKASATVTPVWIVFAIIGLCLFPLEIFVRRVAIDYGFLQAPFVRLLRMVPALARKVPSPRPKAAPVTGFYGARSAAPEADAQAAPEAPRSFGVEAGEPAEITARKKQEKKMAKKKKEVAEATEYTSQLLAAKERARKKTKRQSGGEDKED